MTMAYRSLSCLIRGQSQAERSCCRQDRCRRPGHLLSVAWLSNSFWFKPAPTLNKLGGEMGRALIPECCHNGRSILFAPLLVCSAGSYGGSVGEIHNTSLKAEV